MRDDVNDEVGAGDTAQNGLPDGAAPVIPDELITGNWRRRLVLPDEDGQLRLTPVRTVRGVGNQSSNQIRYLDDNRRHSA